MFICLHRFEQSCRWAYSRCTLLNHDIPVPWAEPRIASRNKGHLELHRHLKQLSSGKRDQFLSGTYFGTSLFYRKVSRVCSCVSPRSLWTHTWRSAFPGSFSGASLGPSWSAPGSPVSLCVLTDSAWMWPVWQVNGREVGGYLGGIWRQIWGLHAWQSKHLWVFALTGDTVWSHTHIHVFNIHLCLLLQLNNHLLVKLLELSEERKKYKQNNTKLKFITHPTTHSWVTWLRSIRKEWSARMHDNAFLRG